MSTKIRGYEVWTDDESVVDNPYTLHSSPTSRAFLFPTKGLIREAYMRAGVTGNGWYIREWTHELIACSHYYIDATKVLRPTHETGLYVGVCRDCGMESTMPHICASGVRLELETIILYTRRVPERFDEDVDKYPMSVYMRLYNQYEACATEKMVGRNYLL